MQNKVNDRLVVGIDASRSAAKAKTGTEYYSFEIIKKIIADKRFHFRLYSKEPLDYLGGYRGRNLEKRTMGFPRLWSQVRLSWELFRDPPDVVFFPAHTIPVYHTRKTVVTLHDAGFRHYPELYTPLERYYHHFCMKFSVRHATKIIAVSHATKKDIIELYRAEAKKITVIYHGYDESKYFPVKKGEVAPAEIERFRPYIYFIGRLEAKKNIKNLVRAFGWAKTNRRVPHKLVLAGRPGYQYEQIRDEINKLDEKIRKDIIELGYVEDRKVGSLMRFADILAFPSNFEGFGMPLVEAMASGVPLVASNTTSIPEIVSDAGLLVSPGDWKALAHAISSVADNEKLRRELVSRGLKRAKRFSWSRCAKETLDVINSTLEA